MRFDIQWMFPKSQRGSLWWILMFVLPSCTTSFGMMSSSRHFAVSPLQSTMTMIQQQETMITQTSEMFDVEDLLYDFPQQEIQSSEPKGVTVVPSRSNVHLSKMATPTSHSSSAQSILINREEALYRQRQGTSFKPNMDHTVLAKSSQLQSEATTQFSRKSMIDVKETGMDSVRSYMKTMCRHELLNKNEEIILAREIQILARWEKHRDDLEANLLRPPTYAEWASSVRPGMQVSELKKQIRRSLRAKAAMTESNIRLVVSIAKRYQNRGMNIQDLTQEGILGLTKACERFDPERGFRFSTYATWWIKQSIGRAIADHSRTIRLPVHIHDQLHNLRKTERDLKHEWNRDPTTHELATKLGITVERIAFLNRVSQQSVSMEQEIKSSKAKGSAAGTGGSHGSAGSTAGALTLGDLMGDPDQQPSDQASYLMLKDDISRLICTLNSREQAVIRMRFGLDDGNPKTLEDIGRKFSVTRERIRQIEARALHKLRQPYRNHSIKCYVNDF